MCVQTLRPRENRVQNILNNLEKNTIFNEHPVTDNGHQQLTCAAQPNCTELGRLVVGVVSRSVYSSLILHKNVVLYQIAREQS